MPERFSLKQRDDNVQYILVSMTCCLIYHLQALPRPQPQPTQIPTLSKTLDQIYPSLPEITSILIQSQVS